MSAASYLKAAAFQPAHQIVNKPAGTSGSRAFYRSPERCGPDRAKTTGTVLRASTNDCITFHHTNLVPGNYEQDDFQVRTPTDIIGQHIHLVKFDVTSSDGSGNGQL